MLATNANHMASLTSHGILLSTVRSVRLITSVDVLQRIDNEYLKLLFSGDVLQMCTYCMNTSELQRWSNLTKILVFYFKLSSEKWTLEKYKNSKICLSLNQGCGEKSAQGGIPSQFFGDQQKKLVLISLLRVVSRLLGPPSLRLCS